MADGIRVSGASATAHVHNCLLHDNEKSKICSGTLRNGRSCSNRASGALDPRLMPTCKTHREQAKISGRCQAPMPCGFDCGRLFEWKPHGFSLCPTHREYEKTCYFTRIPLELRLRIYRYLLPVWSIPAQFRIASMYSKIDAEIMYTEILRVNHQIHDEAVRLLYSARTFTVRLLKGDLIMCNTAKSYCKFVASPIPIPNSHALQDYQMQLMLLEQQNKKRLWVARQEQDNLNAGPSSTSATVITSVQQRVIHSGPTESVLISPTEPVWSPPLAEKHFDMIRSFRIEIVLPFPSRGPNVTTNHNLGIPHSDIVIEKEFESKLYDYIDCLHKLVGRLQLLHTPIACMDIFVEFQCNNDFEQEDAVSAAQLLLQPFRRLGNVTKPKVLSIMMNNTGGQKVELLVPDSYSCPSSKALTDYLEFWTRDLSNSKRPVESRKVFEAYWKLEKLIGFMSRTSYHMAPYGARLAVLRHDARIAREANDFDYFSVIWNQVVNIWFDYLHLHTEFQSKVEFSINDINEILGEDSQMGGQSE